MAELELLASEIRQLHERERVAVQRVEQLKREVSQFLASIESSR